MCFLLDGMKGRGSDSKSLGSDWYGRIVWRDKHVNEGVSMCGMVKLTDTLYVNSVFRQKQITGSLRLSSTSDKLFKEWSASIHFQLV